MTAADEKPDDETLGGLLQRVRQCRICRDHPRHGPPLAHEPRPLVQASATARICIASQAPGIRAHESGRPFNDPSGVRLRQWMGVSDAEFYNPADIAIVPMGFCFPGLNATGSDLPPRKECAETWRQALFERLPAIELLLLIGAHAQRWHLGAAGARTMEGTVLRSHRGGPGALPHIVALPHPSWRNSGWLKRNPWFAAELVPVLQARVRELLGRGPLSRPSGCGRSTVSPSG